MTVMLEPFISPQPNAVPEAIDFAASVACSPARTVTLVFRALGLGAEKGDFRQRTIAAILAGEQRGLAQVFKDAQWFWSLFGILSVGAGVRAPFAQHATG